MEARAQLDEVEQAGHRPRRLQQGEPATPLLDDPLNVEQRADPARIDELDIAQVEHHRAGRVGQPFDRMGKPRCAREIQIARKDEHRPAVHLVDGEMELTVAVVTKA